LVVVQERPVGHKARSLVGPENGSVGHPAARCLVVLQRTAHNKLVRSRERPTARDHCACRERACWPQQDRQGSENGLTAARRLLVALRTGLSAKAKTPLRSREPGLVTGGKTPFGLENGFCRHGRQDRRSENGYRTACPHGQQDYLPRCLRSENGLFSWRQDRLCAACETGLLAMAARRLVVQRNGPGWPGQQDACRGPENGLH
jgi:hypothetical protein